MGGNRNYTDTHIHKNFCVSIWDGLGFVGNRIYTEAHRYGYTE